MKKLFINLKKKNDFDDLNAAIKKNDDYENIEYKTNEKKIQKKTKLSRISSLSMNKMINFKMHYLNALFSLNMHK